MTDTVLSYSAVCTILCTYHTEIIPSRCSIPSDIHTYILYLDRRMIISLIIIWLDIILSIGFAYVDDCNLFQVG